MRRLLVTLAIAAALVIPATAIAQDPTDYGTPANIPGWNDVGAADQAYWLAQLGGNFRNEGSPEPALFLAQWLEVERSGLFLPNDSGRTSMHREPASAADIAIGVAYAKAYAKLRGVTQAQLDAAIAAVAAVVAPKPPSPITATVAPSTTQLGPTAAQLRAIRDRALAAGKHPTSAQVLATWFRHH